jgi:diaminohydroxyphosphoribosylaminopyrimidine deaminase/5-amino-6-(5-phosphoribosylamino)uracil reductase
MQTATDTDRQHLTRAIDLAERGRGRVSPNPLVGALIVRDGEVVGEGWHDVFGGPHAERAAIAAAGDADLRGATIYVSLEPCCHEGKTPPCTEAILEAGLGRVVVASDDPTDKASGRGLGILRDEGVEVTVADGNVAARARLLNQPFRKHARTGRPWVLFKSALTLDGRVATESGDSKWISGDLSREMTHRWRVECDAVAVGIGTALADDPRLTARDGQLARELGAQRQPRRIVFDSTARLPLTSRLIAEAPKLPLTIVTSRAAPRPSIEALESAGVDVIVATGENEPGRVRSALDQLGDQDITSIMLEGGPHLAGAFLDAGEIDTLRLFIAPILLGGASALPVIGGEGQETIADAVRALSLDVDRVGDDVLISARLREW